MLTMSYRSVLAFPVLAVAAMVAAPAARADAVSDWLSIVQDITGRVPSATDPVAEKAPSLVALAMYDAVVALDGGDKPFLGPLEAPRGASAAAAAHAAAHAMLVHLYPQEQVFLEGAYEWALGELPDDAGRASGIVLGVESARRLIAHRAGDAVEATTAWRPVTQAGRFVPPQLPAREWLARQRPFVVGDPDQFRTPGPPALDSKAYSSDFAEVKALGGTRESRRTPAQTSAAKFWHSTDPIQLLSQVMQREGRTLAQNARLFAIYATAMHDAGILLSREKYHHGYWRPVTAIRNADADGNASTTRDATWEPLLATPSHPDYPCGHCLVGALVGAIMAAELGDAPAGGITVTGPANASRHYDTFTQMAVEISNSRVWGGVHFRQGANDGAALGRRLAEHVLTSHFTRLR
jgi:hypothetical protein